MDIKKYVARCLDVLEMCCENERHRAVIHKVQENFKEAVLKDYKPNVLGCFRNSELLKDTKLAKEFQEIFPTLPFEAYPINNDNGENAGLIQMQNSVFDGLNFQVGFMFVDSHKVFEEDRHAGDEWFVILNGTSDWLHSGSDGEYETLSAGNLVYNAPMDLHGTKANHTPMLALYIVVG